MVKIKYNKIVKMFEISSKKVDFEKENKLIKRNINLDKNLDCFILISSNDSNFWELILNNILEYTIDKISKNNAYNDFWVSLENINSFIKTWNKDNEIKPKLDIIIGILNENDYIFSNIWKSSCYLVNKKNEVIELTNKEDNKKDFNFISNWEIKSGEIIISSTKRLYNYLSESDILDWLVLSEDINIFNKNIKNILLSEIINENVLVSSMKYSWENLNEEFSKIEEIKELIISKLDNKFSKNMLWYFLVLKEKLSKQSKIIKNIIFIWWILIAVIFLYSIVSTITTETTENENKKIATQQVLQAKNYIRVASENIANNDIFKSNIENAEQIVEELNNNQIFLSDIEKVSDDINMLKKEFQKIEIIVENPENYIYTENIESPVKIIKNSLKTYIITSKSIIGPVLPNVKAKNYVFNSLEENENFIDASFIWDNLYLLTNNSKVVRFTKNGYFNYIDVSWQKTWEEAKEILSYAQNIYLLWENNNQIYKHNLNWSNFKSWEWYLKEDDLTQIWEILSVTIDGWFYILKKDLSMIKFFSNPYRIEKLVINNLPDNYDIEKPDSIIDIKTRSDLNYVYMLLNDKVWIFKPNTTNYKNTKSLTYIWQIESGSSEIKDFYINHDWEIIILNKKWLYKVTFEISDERILIR